jgi:hypothetical protein
MCTTKPWFELIRRSKSVGFIADYGLLHPRYACKPWFRAFISPRVLYVALLTLLASMLRPPLDEFFL